MCALRVLKCVYACSRHYIGLVVKVTRLNGYICLFHRNFVMLYHVYISGFHMPVMGVFIRRGGVNPSLGDLGEYPSRNILKLRGSISDPF